MSNRKTISRQVQTVSPYDFDTSLKRLRESINELIAQYGEDAQLVWNSDFYHPYDSSPTPRFEVQITCLETDDEMIKREAEEETRRKKNEERERKEYERLQAKFKNG